MADHLKKFTEGIKITATENRPVIEVGWLGSFPRPSYASLIVKIVASVVVPITASIYNPSDGTLWQTVVLSATSTTYVYRGVFRISARATPGTYPVIIKTLFSTYYGYINVYAGTPGGISFH